MDDHGRSLSSDYSWVDGEFTEIVSYYQSVDQLNEMSWSLPGSWALAGPKRAKKACSHFRGCGVITYNILNWELDAFAPFNSFELGVLHHLKVAPSQLHPLSWAIVKVYQFWCEYKHRRPNFRLFFTLFGVRRNSDAIANSWVELYQRVRFFEDYADPLENWKHKYLLVRPVSRQVHESIYCVPLYYPDEVDSDSLDPGAVPSGDMVHRPLFPHF